MQRTLYNRIRRRTVRLLERFKALARLGNYWYWLGDEQTGDELDIKSLVYPFRYDILIRKEYFSFYLENRDLYRSDFPAFLELAKNHAYYLWFTKVAIPRASSELRDNPEEIEKTFIKRLRKSAVLYDRIKEHGFDRRHPIVPHTAELILPTVTGKTTEEKYFMGDGCHRLACLMVLGYKKLPKGYYRVKCYKKFVPLDNTSLLMEETRGRLSWPGEFKSAD